MLRLIGVGLGGVAVAFAGALVWALLFRINLRVTPALPWSAVVMWISMALSYRALSRIQFVPRLAAPSEQGLWPWIAAAAVAMCGVSAVIVGLRLARLPADAFASTIDMHALSSLMQVVRVAMTSSVAAFFEELGFRGLIQGSLTPRYGRARAIGIAAIAFYLAHFGNGWMLGGLGTVLAVAVPILLGGVLFGMLAAWTGSLGPSMMAHALVDLALLPLEWTGKHRLDPVDGTGVDAHFVCWTMAVVLSSIACAASFARLASRSRAPFP